VRLWRGGKALGARRSAPYTLAPGGQLPQVKIASRARPLEHGSGAAPGNRWATALPQIRKDRFSCYCATRGEVTADQGRDRRPRWPPQLAHSGTWRERRRERVRRCRNGRRAPACGYLRWETSCRWYSLRCASAAAFFCVRSSLAALGWVLLGLRMRSLMPRSRSVDRVTAHLPLSPPRCRVRKARRKPPSLPITAWFHWLAMITFSCVQMPEAPGRAGSGVAA
jgi:hypothetical protein